jgi:Domain of unknown function (DUF4262)
MIDLEARLKDPDLEPLDRRSLETIQDFGWNVVLIPEDEEGPGFAFSIGLYYTFNHPEMLITGQKLETMHGIINHVGNLIRNGEVFLPNRNYSEILEGYETAVITIEQSFYRDFLGAAMWFYERKDFPVLQLVWPSRHHLLPWSEGAPSDFKKVQPLLGEFRMETP